MTPDLQNDHLSLAISEKPKKQPTMVSNTPRFTGNQKGDLGQPGNDGKDDQEGQPKPHTKMVKLSTEKKEEMKAALEEA